MSTRGNRSVTKLQEKYATDRPLSFESPLDRRSAYASTGRSLKSLDSDADGRQQRRYNYDRVGAGLQRSPVDYAPVSAAATRSSHDIYGYAGGTDAKHSPHHHGGMSHLRTASASDAHHHQHQHQLTRHHSFQDDHVTKATAEVKRGSSESGYGSLDKENIRRGSYHSNPSADPNPVNAIRDKYLVNRPSASSNGDASRPASYARPHRSDEMRTTSSAPTSASDGLARALQSGSESEEPESRAARIARYKEQRRRELAEKYGIGSSSGESDLSSRRKYSQKEDAPPVGALERLRSLSNASDTAIPLSRRYPSRESLSSITGEVESIQTNGNTSQDNSPATTPRLNRKARRDSNISPETQDFIDALEASRAARRERLRRSETEESSDPADRLIARHRRRKSSVDSSSDVFDSPQRSASRDHRHDDFSDSDSVTSSTSVDRPSRRQIKSDRVERMETQRRQEKKSKSPESPTVAQVESVSSKQSRDKRKRHQQAVSMDDIKKASKLNTAPAQDNSKTKDVPTVKSPSQDLSPRTLKAGGFTIETVKKTDLMSGPGGAKPGELGALKRSASPNKDASKRLSVEGKRADQALKDSTGHGIRVQDSTKHRKNSDSSASASDASSASSMRKDRVGSFSRQSTDSERSGKLQRPTSMPLKDINTHDKKRTSASPDRKKSSKISSSPDRKPLKKNDPKVSPERKVSSASSTSSSHKGSQDKRSSYPPSKTTSPDRKALSRRQSSPEKKMTRPPSPVRKSSKECSEKKLARQSSTEKKSSRTTSPEKRLSGTAAADKKISRTASPEKKLTSKTSAEKKSSRTSSPEKRLSVTNPTDVKNLRTSSSEKRLSAPPSSDKKTTRTTSPEKRLSGTVPSDKKTTRTTSPEKRLSKTSEAKERRTSSPEKRPSTKRTSSPVKKPSAMKESGSETKTSAKTGKDTESKKTKGANRNSQMEEKKPVEEEIVQKKEDRVEEASPPQDALKTPVIPTIIAPSPDRKPSQAKRIRSRTIEVDAPRNFGPQDTKRDALATKDEELFAMMQLRAQQIREEEEREGKLVEEDEEEDDRSWSSEKPEDVIKVSLKDRMHSFKGKQSKVTPVDFSKPPTAKASPKKRGSLLEVPTDRRPEPVTSDEEARSFDEEEADKLASLSLSEKMKMFTQMSALQKKSQDAEEKRAKTRPQRFHRTRGERYQTQPVTPEELTSASTLAKEMAEMSKKEEAERNREIVREIKKDELEDSMDTQERVREEIRQAMLKEKQEQEEEARPAVEDPIAKQERIREEIRQAMLQEKRDEIEEVKPVAEDPLAKQERIREEIRQAMLQEKKEQLEEKKEVREDPIAKQERIREEIRQAMIQERRTEEEEAEEEKVSKEDPVAIQDRIREEIRRAKQIKQEEKEEEAETETKLSPKATQDKIREEIRQAMMRDKIEEEKSEESDDSRLPSVADDEPPPVDVQEDEYTKMSLSEKMRLFKQKSATPQKRPPKVEPPKRKRRSESRFKTQPITHDEVHKAAVSPLARSFVRPPSMELIGSLPLSEQISVVYDPTPTSSRPAKQNGHSVSANRKNSASSVTEGRSEKMSTDMQGKSSKDERPKSYKESVKKQKNLAALIASEVRGTTVTVDDDDDEIEHPKADAVDESIKSARLGHTVTTPTEDIKSLNGHGQSSPNKSTNTTPEPATRKTESISESSKSHSHKQPPSPKSQLPSSPKEPPSPQKQPPSSPRQLPSSPKQPNSSGREQLGTQQKPLSSPERKIRKPQPTPRSPQNIRRSVNGTAKTKETSPPSPVPSPRRSRMGLAASSVRRQDSGDGDISSGAEEVLKVIRVSAPAVGSSSELAKPPRDNKAESTKADPVSSESELEARGRLSPVTHSDIAIIRKKNAQRNGTDKRDRNKTQPVSVSQVTASGTSTTSTTSTTTAAAPALRGKALRAQNPDRFKTQPVTPDELAQLHQMMDPVQTTSSIRDRLSALQKSGQEDWKKRISKYEDSPTSGLKERLSSLNHNSTFQKNNEINDLPGQSSISDRLSLLKQNETTWKQRIEDKDLDSFTVSGKLKQAGKISAEEAETKPQTKLKREGSSRKPRPGSFRITMKRTDSEGSISDTQSSKHENGMSSTATTTTDDDSEPDYRIVRKTVTVMKPDDEGFTDFFASSETMVTTTTATTATGASKKATPGNRLQVSVSDFDALTEGTSHSLGMLSTHRRSLRPARRTRPSTNPLRAMQNRPNIVSEYTEEKIELAEITTKKSKSDAKKDARNVARAGLASKEDIAQGKTKLTTVRDVREMGGALAELLPYKEIMLIQVKGRRFVQVRLVEPRVASLNSGDCFILVTPTDLFLWEGTYANVIEKSKATEIAQHIQQKKDLGCKAPSVTEIKEAKQDTSHSRTWKKFTELLGGKTDYKDVGAPDEDELHEIYITETNMVYKVVGDSLEPYEAFWASPGKFKMLETTEVFVFDFGSEIYIWRGKSSSKKKRKAASQLAQLLWERGYDYSEYDVNPILPQDSKTMSANERPEWTLIGKATQHMETILFKHKFIDWPRETDNKKNGQTENEKNEQAPELVPFDAKLMIQPSREKPHLILEGTNLGRGDAFFSKVDRKGQKINTLSVVVWHVLEYQHSIVPQESFGQFHQGDTYVIRWQYNVENTGMKSLKGTASKWGGAQGRERCAYFFWQGQQSTINEKGASALMTVELDEERGPQKQVVQGKEPAAFLQLFRGRMVVHGGKREEEETETQGSLRLYCVRGEHIKETSLLEVSAKMRSLRSRTSFILLNLDGVHNKKASLHLWHGAKVSKATRECAKHAAASLKEHLPLETGLTDGCTVTLEEMEEGKETAAFFKALGKDRNSYDSAIDDPLKYEYTPRLYNLSSGSGVFVSTEILNPARSTEFPSPYPFHQSDLYNREQPSLFVIDNHYEVYLWQGWWPEDLESHTGTTKTGSALIRWDVDRKLAMETVMAYCKEKRPKKPPTAYLVYAGLEPLTFTNLFPSWDLREDVTKLQKESGKKGDKAILVKDILAKLTQARFTMEELSKRPLPEGVDPMKLETYLSDQEFESVLKMKKAAFYKLPAWKQKDIKKAKALF